MWETRLSALFTIRSEYSYCRMSSTALLSRCLTPLYIHYLLHGLFRCSQGPRQRFIPYNTIINSCIKLCKPLSWCKKRLYVSIAPIHTQLQPTKSLVQTREMMRIRNSLTSSPSKMRIPEAHTREHRTSPLRRHRAIDMSTRENLCFLSRPFLWLCNPGSNTYFCLIRAAGFYFFTFNSQAKTYTQGQNHNNRASEKESTLCSRRKRLIPLIIIELSRHRGYNIFYW